MTFRPKLRLFTQDHRGVAAVEFAMVAPVLVAIFVGIAGVAPFVQINNTMHDALSAGSRYVMAGGTDPAAIQGVTLAAWPNHGSSATISVSQYCTCASIQGSCNALCADGTVPQGYTGIQVSTPYSGALGAQTLTAQQTIRTR